MVKRGRYWMKPTVRNIAERANVSIASVSLVLNNKPSRITEATRQKIIEMCIRDSVCVCLGKI